MPVMLHTEGKGVSLIQGSFLVKNSWIGDTREL